jgi:hypothetical protein
VGRSLDNYRVSTQIYRTGRTYKTRYKEHIRDIKTNGQYSKFEQHITERGHEYGVIEKPMKILHIENKSQKLNTYEIPYI